MDMAKEDIVNIVENSIQKGSNISKCFYPLITEFFVRLVYQYKLGKEELNTYINRFNQLNTIEFGDVDGEYDFEKEKITVNKKYLKRMLLKNRKGAERFIYVMFHELGHLTKHIKQNGKCYQVGLSNIIYGNDKDNNWTAKPDNMDEYAETINADILTNLRYKEDYYEVELIGRTIMSAFSISKEKLAYLQLQGRDKYENYISEKFGEKGLEYLIKLENALDEIMEIFKSSSHSQESKQNLAEKLNYIYDITNNVFRIRLNNLDPNTDVSKLAQIILDKQSRDESFNESMQQFNLDSYERINNMEQFGFLYGTDSNFAENRYQNIFEKSLISKFDKNQLEHEIERIKRGKKSSTRVKYDNTELINFLIKEFKDYDISEFSLKDRIELVLCKKIGEIRGRNKAKRQQLLPEAGGNENRQSRNFVGELREGVDVSSVGEKRNEKPSIRNNSDFVK